MKSEKIKSVPELRFPGFDSSPDEITLLDTCNGEVSNGVFNDPGKREGAYLLVNVLNMFGTDKIDVSSLSQLALGKKEFEKNQVKYGDIFFTRSSLVPAGIAWSNVFLSHEDNVTYDGHLMKISPDLERFSPAYLAQYFRSRPIRKQLIVRGKTGTMTTIGQADIASVELCVPNLPEQQKIAEFLTAVDGRIAQLSRKKALLEDYKKGVMQQLFTQALRFKDDNGNEFPEWDEKMLGEVAEIKTGPFGSTLHQSDYVEAGTPIITVEHLSDHGLVHKNLPLVSDNDRERLKVYSLRENDIVFSRVGSVDRNSVVKKEEEGWLFSGRILRIRPDYRLLDSRFLGYYFQLELTKYRIRSVAVGQTMASLNTEILKAFQVVTATLEEQKRIANFLTALDCKIESVAAQITHTQTWKKGLLQQMFV